MNHKNLQTETQRVSTRATQIIWEVGCHQT